MNIDHITFMNHEIKYTVSPSTSEILFCVNDIEDFFGIQYLLPRMYYTPRYVHSSSWDIQRANNEYYLQAYCLRRMEFVPKDLVDVTDTPLYDLALARCNIVKNSMKNIFCSLISIIFKKKNT